MSGCKKGAIVPIRDGFKTQDTNLNKKHPIIKESHS